MFCTKRVEKNSKPSGESEEESQEDTFNKSIQSILECSKNKNEIESIIECWDHMAEKRYDCTTYN